MNEFESEISREIVPEPEEGGTSERVESGEARDMEASERQLLEEAAAHPEAVVEQRGDFQQAEAVEKIVVEMAATQTDEIKEFDSASAAKVIEGMTPEQKTVLESLSPEDQIAMARVFDQAQKILPGKLPGRSGGIIY